MCAVNVMGVPLLNASLGAEVLLVLGFLGLLAAGLLTRNGVTRSPGAMGIEHD